MPRTRPGKCNFENPSTCAGRDPTRMTNPNGFVWVCPFFGDPKQMVVLLASLQIPQSQRLPMIHPHLHPDRSARTFSLQKLSNSSRSLPTKSPYFLLVRDRLRRLETCFCAPVRMGEDSSIAVPALENQIARGRSSCFFKNAESTPRTVAEVFHLIPCLQETNFSTLLLQSFKIGTSLYKGNGNSCLPKVRNPRPHEAAGLAKCTGTLAITLLPSLHWISRDRIGVGPP